MADSTDVIIVGGGMAGLVAARELRLSGVGCQIVEARDRLGGRIWTREHFGRRRDVGATWVHWAQPHVWAEVSRYGLALAARPPIQETVMLAGGERLSGDLASMGELIGPGLDAFCADCRTAFPLPYGEADTPELRALDDQSIADRIAALDLSSAARDIIDGFWAVNCNGSTSEGALTHALHWVASTGGDWRLFNEACARYKLADGLGALIDAIHAHGRPAVRLGDPARLVEHTDDGVVLVTESGAQIRGRACILALPLNVLAGLEIRPALAPGKRALLAEGAPGAGFKLWARTDRPLDKSYLCMASGSAPLMFARTEDTLASGTVLGFYGADRAALDLSSPAAVEEVVREWIPQARLSEVWSYDWRADELSLQTWRIARPGQLTRYGAEIRRAEGRLLFAGADIAQGAWNGFVDGAIETGLSAAREAAALVAGPAASR